MGFFDKVKKALESKKEDVESQDSVNDEVIDNPTSNEKIRNFKYLDDLIHSGTKKIVLDSDIILEAFEELKYLEGINLDVDELVIDGNGHVIDACGKVRIFKCTAEDVTIKNITLKNGFTQENGGSIYNFKGKLELINSILSGNVSKRNENSNGSGGAIRNWEGDLSIKDSTLSNNVAEYEGGAIDNLRGELKIIRSILRDNSSKKYGGAIENGAGNLLISESTLSNNTSKSGGAIYNSGDIVLRNSELSGNVSIGEYGGGGAMNHYSGEAHVSDSLLLNNCADNEGGAIRVSDELHIVDSKLFKNKAKYGGAIYAGAEMYYGVKLNVERSTFSENVAEEDGGAICEKHNMFNYSSRYHQSSFFSITDSRLCMNRANRGGAIFAEDKMNLNFSSLTSNSAIMGGALFNEDETEVIESELSRNTAEKCGGAIFSEGKLDIAFSRLLTNSADDAGAIYNNGLLSMSNSILSENAVRNRGCEVYNNKFSKFTNIKFEDNDGVDNAYNAGRLIIIDKSFSSRFKTITASGPINMSQTMNRTDEEEGVFEFKQLNDDQKDFTYLQELLNDGKSEIKLEHDIVLDILNGEENIYEEGIGIREDDLTIDGNGHMIDAQCAVPIFNCRGKNVMIKNITLKNGYVYSKSGVINNEGILSMNDCEILNNISRDGGIMYNDSELSVTNCDFQSNQSEDGEILYNLKVCKIFNCKVSANRTSNIILNTDSLQIFNSTFTNNKSKNIIFNDEGKSNLSVNSKFRDNAVEESVVCNLGKSCILDRCIFEDNLRVNGCENVVNQSELTLINPRIKEKAKTILNDGYVLLKDSNSGLKSMIHGEGAVESDEELIPTEQLSDFSYLDKIIHDGTTKEIVLDEDICLEKYESDFYEGGIDLDIDDLVIDGNFKTIDGAGKSRIFIVSGKNITLKNIIFKNGISHQSYDNPLNGHGGALRINSKSNLEIINCEFIGNVSEDCAGAIYNVDGACLDIVDCSFNQNKSNSSGGSILNEGELKCNESIFKDGSSNVGGGAIVSNGILTVSKSQFLNNSSNRGGALTIEGELDLDNSKFITNKSENSGGAIYIQSNSKVSIENSTFQNNNASSGGAIYNGGELNLANVEFITNIANHNGGAINTLSSSILHVKESVFTGNKSIFGGVGGGINTDRGADFEIVDSCFNGNGAYKGGAIYDSTEESVVSGCKYMTEHDQVKFAFDD